MWKSILEISKDSALIATSVFLVQLVQTTTLMFVGKNTSKEYFQGIGLAQMWLKICCQSIYYGVSSGLDTFFSQSFGAGNISQMHQFMQRGFAIMFVLGFPLALIFTSTQDILLWLGQDPEASANAHKYMQLIVPGLWPMLLNQVIVRYQRSQNINKPQFIISLVSAALHGAFCYFFIAFMRLGIEGAAYSTILTYWVQFLMSVFYQTFMAPQKIEWKVERKVFLSNWGPILKLGIPGIGMYMIEWWSFQASTIFGGIIGGSSLAAHLAVLSTFELMEMITIGVSSEASTIVGNKIGENKPEKAKELAKACIFLSVGLCCITNLGILLFRQAWAGLCTNDDQVFDMIVMIIPIYIGASFCDSLNDVMMGILTGVGQQSLAAVINTIGYYIVAIPVMYILAFWYDFGVLGIWLGIFIGNGIAFVLLILSFNMIDWKKQAFIKFEKKEKKKNGAKVHKSQQQFKEHIV